MIEDINCNCASPPIQENQSGNDGSVVLNVNGDLVYFYLQMKIKLNINDIIEVKEKFVKMISYNLLEYARANVNSEEVNYNNVHMILYVWGLEQQNFSDIFPKESFSPIDDQMKKLVNEQFSNIKKENERTLPSGFDEEIIINYMNDHWDHFHFVGEDKMQTWLSPSFLSFPMLATLLDEKN